MLDREDLWRFRYYVLERLEEGRLLDDLLAEALLHVWETKNPDLRPESLGLRQKLVDTKKRIFKAEIPIQVNLIAENDRLTVFEVRKFPECSDVGFFAMKVELVAAQNPEKPVQGVLISLAAPAEVHQRCAEHGLELVD